MLAENVSDASESDHTELSISLSEEQTEDKGRDDEDMEMEVLEEGNSEEGDSEEEGSEDDGLVTRQMVTRRQAGLQTLTASKRTRQLTIRETPRT